MHHLWKLLGLALSLVWGVVLAGFVVLVLLCFPFTRRGKEWRHTCRWEEDE